MPGKGWLGTRHETSDQTDEESNQALTPLQRVRYGLGLRKQFELLNDLEVRPKLHCGA